jgi:hypothetical protein
MEPTVCLETSTINYHYSLNNNPEERSAHKNIFFNLVQKLKTKSFPLYPTIYFAARTDERSGKQEEGFSTLLRNDFLNQACASIV